MPTDLFQGGEEIRKRADYDERKRQAERRAQWELGDPSWAGVILGAFLFPEEDAARLAEEDGVEDEERYLKSIEPPGGDMAERADAAFDRDR